MDANVANISRVILPLKIILKHIYYRFLDRGKDIKYLSRYILPLARKIISRHLNVQEKCIYINVLFLNEQSKHQLISGHNATIIAGLTPFVNICNYGLPLTPFVTIPLPMANKILYTILPLVARTVNTPICIMPE